MKKVVEAYTTSRCGQFQVLFEHCHELTQPHTERCDETTDDQKSRQINTRLQMLDASSIYPAGPGQVGG
jgi:hypothetical protein